MRFTYLKIRGSIGIKKGQGVDEIEFDLTNKTGLVALAGPNGSAKSTVLELMSLFRTLASRKGSLRHHFFLRDSVVEKKFIHCGSEYHIIWKIDSGSDRAEAFIVVDGESVVNGKLSDYDKYIIDNFGSQNLFYNSVFCAQGAEDMSKMTTGKIKELFVEFLRIERLVEHEKTAKGGITYYTKKIAALSAQVITLTESANDLIYSEERLKGVVKDIKTDERVLKELSKAIEYDAKAIKACEGLITENEKKIEQKKSSRQEIGKLNFARDEKIQKFELIFEAYEEGRVAPIRDMERANLVLADKEKILTASSGIKSLTKWEKYFSKCFECAIDEQDDFNRKMEETDQAIKKLEIKVTDLENDLVLDGLSTTTHCLYGRKTELESNLSILEDKLVAAHTSFELDLITEKIKTCKEKILMAIDPDCKSTICPALDIVAVAKEELPLLEEKGKRLKLAKADRIEYIKIAIKLCESSTSEMTKRIDDCSGCRDKLFAEISSFIGELKREIAIHDKSKTSLVAGYLTIDEFKTFYKSRLVGVGDKIASLEDLAAKAPDIKIAEEKIESLNLFLRRIEKVYMVSEKEHHSSLDVLSNEILLLERKLVSLDTEIDKNAESTLTSLVDKKRKNTTAMEETSGEIEKLKQTEAVLQNDVSRQQKVNVEIDKKKYVIGAYETELKEWDYLRLACSKTGLQALEIDGATPLIMREANILLEKAFSLDFQIKIITQDPESGKEVFWIRVIRANGSEDDFGNLSGGQRVWIATALSLGMTLVSKRKSGRDLRTLFADEKDGALDRDNAVSFIKLYRAMMATGDFDTLFFISHNPELVSMADHEIEF